MQADFSIELGGDDETLELPWSTAAGDRRYYDLKREPERLLDIQEAFGNQALGEFLASTNSPASLFETAKCDCWFTLEIAEEEKIFGEPGQPLSKFGSYVDIVLSRAEQRSAFASHQQLARAVCALLQRAPEISCAAEFCVRRCYYTAPAQPAPGAGFGITFYLYGYGADEAQARRRWEIGLKLVENALLQISAQARKEPAC